MKITIEIDDKSEMEKLSAFFKTFKINKVKVISADDNKIPVVKGDKKIDPTGLFGICANNPRSLEDIRKDAWQRKTDIG
jgi:hypothetical protein